MNLTPRHELNIGLSPDGTRPVLLVDGKALPPRERVTIDADTLARWIVGVIGLAVAQAEKPAGRAN